MKKYTEQELIDFETKVAETFNTGVNPLNLPGNMETAQQRAGKDTAKIVNEFGANIMFTLKYCESFMKNQNQTPHSGTQKSVRCTEVQQRVIKFSSMNLPQLKITGDLVGRC